MDDATPTRKNLKQLAAEAGLPLSEAQARLRGAGVEPPYRKAKVDGRELREIRIALGLPARRHVSELGTSLEPHELDARLLVPMLRKGKVGRQHTTPVENVYGHGVPGHQVGEAKARVDSMIAEGLLEEKSSQGRRHVWLTNAGRARAEELRGG
jgi:hypothetical protein